MHLLRNAVVWCATVGLFLSCLSCAGGPERQDKRVEVAARLVYLCGSGVDGVGGEREELLADAVSMITMLGRLDGCVVGGDLVDAGAGAPDQLLGSVVSLLSIVAAPRFAVLDDAVAASRAAVSVLMNRKLLGRRNGAYSKAVGQGVRLVVLPPASGEAEARLLEWFDSELAKFSEPVVLVARHKEPATAAWRTKISRSPRIQALLCAFPQPSGRPQQYPEVYATPALATSHGVRVLEVDEQRMLTYLVTTLAPDKRVLVKERRFQ